MKLGLVVNVFAKHGKDVSLENVALDNLKRELEKA
jgi:hypothetical protein